MGGSENAFRPFQRSSEQALQLPRSQLPAVRKVNSAGEGKSRKRFPTLAAPGQSEENPETPLSLLTRSRAPGWKRGREGPAQA